MKITAIKQQTKQPDRVSIYVDGTYSFSLTLDQLLDQKLKKDLELTDTELKVLKKLSTEGKLRARTLEWVLLRPRAEREVREYLYRKKAEPALIDSLVAEFRQKTYLDDDRYTRWLVEARRRKQRSERAIISELRSKGISPDTIKNIVTEQSAANDDEQAVREIVNKLRKRSRYADEQKLIRYLIAKGFAYELVKRVMTDQA